MFIEECSDLELIEWDACGRLLFKMGWFLTQVNTIFFNLEIVEILCIGRSHNCNQNMAASLRVMFIEFYESLPKFAEDCEYNY